MPKTLSFYIALAITCAEGVQRFNTMWKSIMDESILFHGRKWFGFLSSTAEDNSLARLQIMRYLPVSFNYLMGSESNTAESVLKQQLMMNAVIDGVTSNSSRAEHYKMMRAKTMQRANQDTAGLLALNMLPIMRTVLEAIAYALFIFVVVLSAMPGGINIVVSYAKLLISLQLWAPLYSILNLLVSFYAQQSSQNYLGGQGLTMLTSVGLSEINQDIASYAGYLSMMIPAIAWGITQGGASAFASLTSSALSNMQNNIAKATDEATSGNLSLDNHSIGNDSRYNTSSFKFNNTLGFDSGRSAIRQHSGAMLTTNPDGRSIIDAGVGSTASNLLQNVNLQGSIMSSMAQSADHYETLAQNQSVAASLQQARAMNSAIEFAQHLANSDSSGQSWANSDSSGVQKALNRVLESTQAFNENHQLDSGRSAKILAAAAIASDQAAFGRIVQDIFGISGRAEGSVDSNSSWRDLYQDAKTHLSRSSFQANLDHATKAIKDGSFRTNDDIGQRFADNIRTSMDKSHSYREEASASLQKADSFRKAYSLTESAGASYGTNMNQAFYEWLQGEVGQEKANKMLSSSGYEVMPYVTEFAEKTSEKIAEETQMHLSNTANTLHNRSDIAVDNLKSKYQTLSVAEIQPEQEEIMYKRDHMREVVDNFKDKVEDSFSVNEEQINKSKDGIEKDYQKFSNQMTEKEKSSVMLEAAKIPVYETVGRPLANIYNARSDAFDRELNERLNEINEIKQSSKDRIKE